MGGNVQVENERKGYREKELAAGWEYWLPSTCFYLERLLQNLKVCTAGFNIWSVAGRQCEKPRTLWTISLMLGDNRGSTISTAIGDCIDSCATSSIRPVQLPMRILHTRPLELELAADVPKTDIDTLDLCQPNDSTELSEQIEVYGNLTT